MGAYQFILFKCILKLCFFLIEWIVVHLKLVGRLGKCGVSSIRVAPPAPAGRPPSHKSHEGSRVTLVIIMILITQGWIFFLTGPGECFT